MFGLAFMRQADISICGWPPAVAAKSCWRDFPASVGGTVGHFRRHEKKHCFHPASVSFPRIGAPFHAAPLVSGHELDSFSFHVNWFVDSRFWNRVHCWRTPFVENARHSCDL